LGYKQKYALVGEKLDGVSVHKDNPIFISEEAGLLYIIYGVVSYMRTASIDR